MSNVPYRALVVDDEPAVRHLTLQALSSRGMSCDVAGNGLEAEQLLETRTYDIVITDLRMPVRHGHALVVDLLSRPRRPAIVVLTGVAEPRLAEDLLARGVDAIDFKPVDFRLFSAKVWALVERRRAEQQRAPGLRAQAPSASAEPLPDEQDDPQRKIGQEEFKARLARANDMLPISAATLEVVQLTSADSVDADDLAAHLTLDPALTVEILKLANSSLYNPSGDPISDLRGAVVRVGNKRIGELALAAAALNALTARQLSWMDLSLCWRRCLATGLTIETLQAQSTLGGDLEGLFLTSLLHRLGRVLLAWIYPAKYQYMAESCVESGMPLSSLEASLFPVTTTRAMSTMLASWNISRGIYRPLEFVASAFSEIETLTDPLRLKIELVKTASLLADLTVGRWEVWDVIEFPSAATQRRVGKTDLYGSSIEQAREDLTELAQSLGWSESSSAGKRGAELGGLEVGYCNLSYEPFDFLAATLTSAGVGIRPVSRDEVLPESPVLLNCLGVSPERLPASFAQLIPARSCVVVTDPKRAREFRKYAQVLALPCSFGLLVEACRGLATAESDKLQECGA